MRRQRSDPAAGLDLSWHRRAAASRRVAGRLPLAATRTTCFPTAWPRARSSPAGIGAFRMTETCNVEASLWSSLWLYRILGDRTWGDRIERAVLQRRAGAPSPATSKRCATTSRPTASSAESLPSFPNGAGEWLRFTPAGLPAGALLRRLREPHHSQLRDPHVDGHGRRRPGGHALRPRARSRPWPATASP